MIQSSRSRCPDRNEPLEHTIACDDSPIDREEDVTTELDVTTLSLPESFDDTFCLDLYKEFEPESNHKTHEPVIKGKQSQSFIATKTSPRRTTNTQYEEMETKIRTLLEANLELKEEARQYNNLASKYSHLQAQNDELSKQLHAQSASCQSSDTREKELQHQVLELRRKCQLAEIDLDHSKKEIELLTSRSEKYEVKCQSNETSLKSLQSEHDKLISRHAKELDELKTKTASEIDRARRETSEEIILSRNHQKETFAREMKLLSDAKDYAFEQVKSLQKELHNLRSDTERKGLETADLINELERQLADSRSDLKVKTCELNTLQASYDRVTEEARDLDDKYKKSEQKLNEMQIKFLRLDKESLIERSRLEENLRQKEDALELYQHDDLLIEDADCQNNDPNARSMIDKRKSLIKNSIALAKKCRELQTQVQKSTGELSIEKEKTDALTRRIEQDRRMYQELCSKGSRKSSEYITSAINEREAKISSLNVKVHNLQAELEKMRQERDHVANTLHETLERRKHIDSMKVFIDEGTKKMNISTRIDCNDGCKLNEDSDDQDDLLEHIIYHNKMAT